MNIKFHTVLSDIDGASGLRIVVAILAGERDPEVLANLCDVRVKASREDIVKSLEGYWSDEHLFELEQCYELYKFHNDMIVKCELKIEKILQDILKSKNGGVLPEQKKGDKLKRKPGGKSDMCIDVANLLFMLTGVDLVSVEGITGMGAVTALGIFSELGCDGLERFKTEKHFTSWLGLSPNNKESAGKIISSRIPKKKHHAGQRFRMAAMGLRNNKGPLGDYYRKLRATAGAPKAVVALARKLAVIYYHMMTNKTKYNPQSLIDYQEKQKEYKIKYHERCLKKLREAA